MSTYEQGELIYVDFDPTYGHEPNKLRPALVVSVGYHNNVLSSLVTVCPITSVFNGHPLHIPIPDEMSSSIHGCICLEQIRAIDLESPARKAKKTEEFLDKETMATVLDGLGAMFGI